MATEDRADNEGAKRFRSPPYPQITLSKAIERARELHGEANRHAASVSVVARAWGIKETTGTLWTTAASMIQYGLLTDEGSGDKRKFQLTDAAFRLVLDGDLASEKRRSALQRVAIAPKIHAELWEKFKAAAEVSDALLKSYLTLDRQEEGKAPYSDTSADDVIRVYRDAIAFAGLSDSGSVSSESQVKDQPLSDPPAKEASAVTPQTIIAPKDERVVQAQAAKSVLDDGERELTSGLLSRGSSFRLVVKGRIGSKELETLIKKLEIDKEILAEPDDERPEDWKL